MNKAIRLALIAVWFGFCGFSPWPFGCSKAKETVIVFTPVGGSFGSASLIDLEFLPGGDLIVIRKDGVVSYVTPDFEPLAQTFSLEVPDEGEQGLLALAADPGYDSNRFIYLYYTMPTGEGGRLDRFTVEVDVAAGSFTLSDQQNIAAFLENPEDSGHHIGGGMVFGPAGDLFLGVGDGFGTGGVLRLVPNRVSEQGGFALSEVYALGLPNPSSLVAAALPEPVFFAGGGGTASGRIDLLTAAGQDFASIDPLHGYGETDNAFAKQDPEESEFDAIGEDGPSPDPPTVRVGAYYTGEAYGDELKNRLLYADFFQGWVRGLRVNGNEVDDDRHLGHQPGLMSVQEGPDGLLYAVSLFGSDRILRIDPAPED